MSIYEDPNMKSSPPHIVAAPPLSVDVENTQTSGESGFGVGSITRRWRRDDMLKRGNLALRGIALLFSLLAFIVMASNQHGDWKTFSRYEEYRYVLAIALLSTLYTGGQALKQVHELSTGKTMLEQKKSALVDFCGDQIMAYLLMSAASAAVPLTNSMRENVDNIFTDSSATAIAMEFFAFLALGLSALISGYKLSTQSYM